MNTHDIDIELPAEFQSGNSIPVERTTITRERMTEILKDAIEADRKRSDEPVALAKDGNLFWRGDPVAWREFSGELYLAPQPDEPVNSKASNRKELLLSWVLQQCAARRYEGGAYFDNFSLCRLRYILGELDEKATQPDESHVDRANRIVDSWPEWKRNYALTKHDVKPTQPAEPDYKQLFEQMCERCDALDAKLAEYSEREPVAYGIKAVNTGKIAIVLYGSDVDQVGEYRADLVVPLYTTPHQAEPVKVSSDDDLLTIVYMSGYHDGKRSATLDGWQPVPKELMRLMPEVLASLRGSGVDVSLAADVERALAAAPKFGEEK